jgi:hypothetical protein
VHQAELISVAKTLRDLPVHEDQSFADSLTQELAKLFESFSASLARSASAAASMAASSAGVAAAAALPCSPYKTLPSSSPTSTPYGGSSLSRSTAEFSFLTISREVEVSSAVLVVLQITPPLFAHSSCKAASSGSSQSCADTD